MFGRLFPGKTIEEVLTNEFGKLVLQALRSVINDLSQESLVTGEGKIEIVFTMRKYPFQESYHILILLTISMRVH